MSNPVKITPGMDQQIVLSGEKTAECTVTECSKESTAFGLDAVEENQDSFPKLYKAIYGGDARMHADYIYVGTEGEAIIELKHWKEFDEEKIKPAMEQIRETLDYLQNLKDDCADLAKRFSNRDSVKKIIIITNKGQKRSKSGENYERDSIPNSFPKLPKKLRLSNSFTLKFHRDKCIIQEAELLRLDS